MLAVIATGGKQYLVKEHETLKVEKLELEVGKSLNLPVLMTAEETGAEVKVGKPEVVGAQVEAKVLEHGKGDKVMIQRYKNKTRYRRLIGYRQPFTKIEIVKIS